jgi:ATP adenylyltransferase
MEKLWSPWRSKYIESFKDDTRIESDGSLFTRISNQTSDKENYLLHRGKSCFIIMNLYPYNSGHLLVIPYKETKDLSELDSDTRLELFELIDLGCRILNDALKPHGFNIGRS